MGTVREPWKAGAPLSDRFSLVPASYLIFRRGGQVLLQLRRGTGYMDEHWATAAAGHVEAGESALEAALREAKEELGVTVAPDAVVPVTAMHRRQGEFLPVNERVDFFFACTEWEGEPRIMEPGKAAELRWFRLDSLPTPMVPHELSVFELLAGGVPPILTHGFS
ncbi:NUDIX domain-containing protein [Arthrobacter jiangjiafuii]|uniref:NUDIX domain-containing protein n=1 Tax=Arthrobacter jiangjiafuii TaxID=2817475 RepID=A0A975M7J5_9MICC|nr:NUDIX domain-containing protein [Arthrobacter jiangjiafuii]QWC11416.1 NUDIX domain-containing protein [Arthrobacter jiangjiafuii]